ncbi:MAG TPA: hypothetical protein VEI03_06540 [Stellaceae bacterium]|nr:hypothetical protein [Stellaceae bacterium]
MRQGWDEEWQALLRWQDEALARARGIQAEIGAVLRRREAPPMQLLRAADRAESELAEARARLKEFLRQAG